MEIKITYIPNQGQAVTRDFTDPETARKYLDSMVEKHGPVEGVELEEGPVEETGPAHEPGKDFTNEQRFEVGQHVMFHQLVGPYSGEHVIIEEREEEIGHSYRTDQSGETFIHAHWFRPVVTVTE